MAAAEALGMHGVLVTEAYDQAIAQLEALLSGEITPR